MANLAKANRTYHAAQSQMELLPNYYAWTYGAFRSYLRGEVIELGCGAGAGIATYVDSVDRVYAVDHDASLLAKVRASFPKDRVEAIEADLGGNWRELAGLRADAVILMDVLEHFEDDLAFLKKASELVKSSGYIAVKVPAHSRLYSPMDEASGHFRRYDPDDIGSLARRLGLEIVRLEQLNRIGRMVYAFKRDRPTNFSRTFSPFQLRVVNRAIPLVRAFDVMPGLSGLSIAAVLQVCRPSNRQRCNRQRFSAVLDDTRHGPMPCTKPGEPVSSAQTITERVTQCPM